MTSPAWSPVCDRPAGLVFPAYLDKTGEHGPTRVQARMRRWEQVGHGWYVPADRPDCVEQRILDAACVLRHGGAVTGWGALRWHGAAYFDGRSPSGADQLPVPLLLGGTKVRPRPPITISQAQLAPTEWRYVAGLPVTTVQRALFDEVVRRGELWAGIAAVSMAAAARLISADLFAQHLLHRQAWTGVPLARKVAALARDDLRSPREVWLHLVWELVAELPRSRANQAVFDRQGHLVGVPDLFDPVSGTVGEYDGAHHKGIDQHRADVAREERFRDHGLEYFAIVRGDSRPEAAGRIRRTRTRAKFLPPESCAWTLEPPDWYRPPEPVDELLRRTGRAADLTHR